MLKRNNLDKINAIKNQIKTEYINTGLTPWIIGYSGGKDSTTVLQLVIEVLIVLKEEGLANKQVYVISSDTLVENPLVIVSTLKSMERIQLFAKENNLPLQADLIYPEVKDSFLVKMIGNGYPAPIQSFRWCTDRIKIKPANKYIYSKIDENGECILLLGTREAESVSRKRSMDKYVIKGSNLSVHSSITNAFTYAPIAKLTVNEVWSYLLKVSNPWGDDNHELYNLYANSSADEECPLVIDAETKDKQTCGNSRFGCWTCTVVTEDKSLKGFIASGSEWLKPFLDYRSFLIEIRDDEDKRNIFNKKGNIMKVDIAPKDGKFIIPKKFGREKREIDISEVKTEEEAYEIISSGKVDLKKNPIIVEKNGGYYRVGVSSMTIDTRKIMLEELLKTEEKIRTHLVDYEIIRREEILEIDKIWKEEGYFEYSALEIYNLFHSNLFELGNENIDYALLEELASKFDFDKKTLFSIIYNSNSNKHLKNRSSNIRLIKKAISTQKLLLRK